jgi:DNA-binding GntR family transcriptional regulator
MNRNTPANNFSERQKIVEELKAGIASGKLKPGQRLVEAHLSEAFGVKRNNIREVLRKLEQDGFVKIIPNVGAKVAVFSQKDIEHIYDLLSVVEGLAVKVITPFITAEQIKSIEVLIKKMEATHKAPLFYEYNNNLHSLFITWSENDHLIKLTDNLRFKIRCVNLQGIFTPGQIPASNNQHRKIFEAIKDRNSAKAEHLMRNHLVDAKNRLIKYLNKSL